LLDLPDDGLTNVYSKIDTNYIPADDLIIKPFKRHYILNNSLDLREYDFKNTKLYYKNGFTFDYPE
jgi:hypothetical protein